MTRVAYLLTVGLMFVMPWEQSVDYQGLGTISRLVGICAASAWVLAVAGSGRMRRLIPFHAAAFLFVLWNGLTVFWSHDQPSSVVGFVTYAQILLLLVIVWDVVDREERVHAMLQAYVFGAFVTVGGIIVSFLENQQTIWERYSAPGAQTGVTAFVVAVGMPAAIYLAETSTARRGAAFFKAANYGYVPAATFAIILTGTRGAAIASVPTAFFLVWAVGHTRRWRKVAIVAALASAAALIVSFAPSTSVERIASSGAELEGAGDLTGRVEIWHDSVNAFLGAPLTGVGHDATRATLPTGNVAHNTALSILLETGIVGFALFVAMLATVASAVRRLSGIDARFWLVQLAVVVLGTMSLSAEDAKAVWAFAALAVAAGHAARPDRLAGADRRAVRATTVRPP